MSEEFEVSLDARILADDLLRLSARLQRLSGGLGAEPECEAGCETVRRRRGAGHAYAPLAQRIYDMRRQRSGLLPDELFADPAWDILLDLYIQEAMGREVSVTSVCLASGVPATTGLRWLHVLEEHGLVERREAPHDLRVKYVRLTAVGARKMHSYFEAVDRRAHGNDAPFLLGV